jgi:hypothetical protein
MTRATHRSAAFLTGLFCFWSAAAQPPKPKPAAAKPAAAKPAAAKPKPVAQPAKPTPDPAPTAKGITRADLVKKADTLLKSSKLAVVASVSEYKEVEPELSNLLFTTKDMVSMKQALEAQGYTVLQLQNAKATATNIRDSLKGLRSIIDKPEESTVVFYFSGHGFASGDDNYLATYGSTITDLPKQGLAIKEVKQLLEETGAAQRMVFVDACRNDPNQKSTGPKRTIASFASQSGTKVLFSTAPGQFSYEEPAFEQGRFTHYLIRGLQGEAAKEDEFVSWDDLKTFMVSNMRAHSMKDLTKAQIPWTDDQSSGDFLIGKKLAPSAIPAPAVVAKLEAAPAPTAAPPPPAPVTDASRAIITGGTTTGSKDTWGSIMHPGHSFVLRVDKSNIYILEGTETLGVLEAKTKKSGEVERYEGKVRLAPASKCPEGQGRAYIEYKDISENRIKIRIEEPSKDSKTHEISCGAVLPGIMRKMLGPETVFMKRQ